MLPRLVLLSLAAILTSAKLSAAQSQAYYGKYIGKLKTLHHSVTGEVFAVDARTLHIRDFTYDGEGPAAYFYAGNSKYPSASGFRINDEKGTPNPLQRYRKKHVTITLPEGKTLHSIKWFSVWCDEFSVNFGDVKIPKNLDFPKPQNIDALNGVHLVSSEPIVVVDAQTLLIRSFSYDGEAPDAKFWVGQGSKPSPQGVRVPDENGKEVPLRRYDRKNIVLTLPGELTVFDIGHFGVWCEAFAVDFGHVRIPRGLNVPPSLRMLGVAPQKRARSLELAPDQTRNQQLVFNNPEQHTFRGGVPSGDPSFFNNYYNKDNTFFRDQQQFSSLTGSPTNLDIQSLPGQNIRATTYKPTINLPRQPQQQLQQLNQQQLIQHQQLNNQRQQFSNHQQFNNNQQFNNHNQPFNNHQFNNNQQLIQQQQQFNHQQQQQQQQRQQQGTHNSFSLPIAKDSSIEILRSVSRDLSDISLPSQPRPSQNFNNAFQQQDPRFFNTAQTQQTNVFLQPNPNHFISQANQFEQNRRIGIAESRSHISRVPNNNYSGGSFSRLSFNGANGGQSFVRYK